MHRLNALLERPDLDPHDPTIPAVVPPGSGLMQDHHRRRRSRTLNPPKSPLHHYHDPGKRTGRSPVVPRGAPWKVEDDGPHHHAQPEGTRDTHDHYRTLVQRSSVYLSRALHLLEEPSSLTYRVTPPVERIGGGRSHRSRHFTPIIGTRGPVPLSICSALRPSFDLFTVLCRGLDAGGA